MRLISISNACCEMYNRGEGVGRGSAILLVNRWQNLIWVGVPWCVVIAVVIQFGFKKLTSFINAFTSCAFTILVFLSVFIIFLFYIYYLLKLFLLVLLFLVLIILLFALYLLFVFIYFIVLTWMKLKPKNSLSHWNIPQRLFCPISVLFFQRGTFTQFPEVYFFKQPHKRIREIIKLFIRTEDLLGISILAAA